MNIEIKPEEKEALKRCLSYLKACDKGVLQKLLNRLERQENKCPRYQEFLDAYYHWRCQQGTKPRIGAAQAQALKRIIRYLLSIDKIDGDEEQALRGWQFILQNWELLTPFIRNQVTLAQIDKNLEEILQQLRNAKHTKQGQRIARQSQWQAFDQGAG